MGKWKVKRQLEGPAFNIIVTKNTTGTMLANRLVRLTTGNEVRHTTGTSGRRVFGVALTTGTQAAVQIFGIVDVVASTGAIQVGMPLVATSGALASTSFLGGTVKTVSASTILNRRWTCGISLTSAAAGTTRRTVSVFLTPIGIGTTQTVG